MMRSANFNDREGTPIDMLVMHYTGMPTGRDALERLCDPAADVSAHYLIEEDGSIHSLVDEEHRAWHAGVAAWRGETNINSRSIGIELVNPGHEFGYRAFPDQQISVLIDLCRGVLERHDIPARNVIGHSDVAPTRKEDPGELFPWSTLSKNGIGLWPDDAGAFDPVQPDDVGNILTDIGYEIFDPDAALVAFQRHFAPDSLGKGLDERTRRSLAAVVAML